MNVTFYRVKTLGGIMENKYMRPYNSVEICFHDESIHPGFSFINNAHSVLRDKEENRAPLFEIMSDKPGFFENKIISSAQQPITVTSPDINDVNLQVSYMYLKDIKTANDYGALMYFHNSANYKGADILIKSFNHYLRQKMIHESGNFLDYPYITPIDLGERPLLPFSENQGDLESIVSVLKGEALKLTP